MNFDFLRVNFFAAGVSPRRENIAALAIAVISAYLILFNLDYATLWHDEGANALMARSLANNGTFSGWDGRNLFWGIDNTGGGIDKNLNIVSYPPWPVFPSALGLLLFGEGEFAIRFPHALLGALSLPLFWLLLLINFPARPRLRLLAFAMFALSPIVILYMRQGRYYADAIFFALLCVYFYQKYRLTGRTPWLAGLSLATVLNFLNHFAIGFAAAAALAAWHLILHWRETSPRQWLELSAAGMFAAACCGGYLFWAGIIGGDSALEYGDDLYAVSWLERRFFLLRFYFRDLVKTGWLPFWAALWWCWFAGAFFFRAKPRRKKNKKKAVKTAADGDESVRRWALLALLMIAASAIVSVQPPVKHSLADMRYMVFALPFVIFMSAACADWMWAKDKTAGGVLTAVLMLSNFAAHPFIADVVHKTVFNCPTEKFPLPALVREIHRPYPSAIAEASAYLRKHTAQDDTVFVQPQTDYTVLLYYLSDKLTFCCGLSRESDLPEEKIRALGAPVYEDAPKPEWLVLMGSAPGAGFESYQKVYEGEAFSYPTHRPELEYRCFEPDPDGPKLSIYRRG